MQFNPTPVNRSFKFCLHNKYLLALLLCPTLAFSAEPMSLEAAFMRCKQDNAQDNEKRLACFDLIGMPTVELVQKTDADASGVVEPVVAEKALDEEISENMMSAAIAELPKKIQSEQTYLERKWRLSSTDDWLISDLEAHHQNYLMTTLTSAPNRIASSPSFPNTESRNLENKDVQFQISLKTQVMDELPIIKHLPWVTSSRLWLAYTQKSYWQIYNGKESRPFRESNYAPEIILSLGLDNQINGQYFALMPRMANLGFIHESNGGADPISRSWNRVYLESAWQIKDKYTLSIRPWWRIPETDDKDDNPDIEKFLGYGDLNLRWDDVGHKTAVSLLLRNNFRADNKGYAKLSVTYEPFDAENVKLFMSLSTGYGESLVDYNHAQNVFGIGFAVGE